MTPAEVLQQFHELRCEVLAVISEAEQIADGIPAIAAAAKTDLEFARLQVSQLHLSLAVVGAEGAGKSTLIRGLLKQELSPIEGTQPGTVAPVYLTHGEGEPTFTVEFSEAGKPPLQCDRVTCFEYIQQKTNVDNVKNVSRAIIQVDNPLLAHGLVLVDAPGVGGVSDAVRIATQDFIRSQAAAVIGVARDRSYSPLVEIAREYSSPNAKKIFQAIVSNRSLDYFMDEQQTGVLPDSRLDTKFKETRADGLTSLQRTFKQYGLDDQLGDDSIFVFNANVLHLLDEGKHKLATGAHRLEVDRFLDKIARYAKENGLGYNILRATNVAELVINTRLAGYVELRKTILTRVLAGDHSLREAFLQAVQNAYPVWRDAYNDDSMEQIEREVWHDVLGVLTRQRKEAVKKIDALLREFLDQSHQYSKQVIRDKLAVLRLDIADNVAVANEAFLNSLDKVHKTLISAANAMLKAIFAEIPIFEQSGSVDVALSASDIVRIGINQADSSDKHMMYARFAGLAGGAAAGGVLATHGAALLVFAPDPTFITQTIGIIIGGAAAFKAVDVALRRAFGGEREAAIRELTIMRDRQVLDDDQQYAKLRDELNRTVRDIGQAVDAALNARIKQVGSILSDPSPRREQIQAEADSLDAVRGRLDKLSAKLGNVRSAAQS